MLKIKLIVLVLYLKTVLTEVIESSLKKAVKMDSGVDEPIKIFPADRDLDQNVDFFYDDDGHYKLYLYQRIKLDFDQDSTIHLNYGLDKEKFTSTSHLDFKIDLSFDQVMININLMNCHEDENCHKTKDGQRENDVYQGKEYTYFDSEGFLGVNRVRPGEIIVEKNEDIENFYKLPIRFFDNTDEMENNILGLAPNSPIWHYWKDIYHFPGKHVNMTVCYNKDNEYVLFDSYIDMNKEIMFKVNKGSTAFRFKASLTYSDKATTPEEKSYEVCISNQQNLTMKLTQPIMDRLKAALCQNPNDCTKRTDLFKEDPIIDFQLKMADYQRTEDFFTTKFLTSSFYSIDSNGHIQWKVEGLNASEENSGCQIILEQEFLKEKYLMISNNIEDDDSIYVGFKLILPSDFTKFDFYTVTMIVLIIATIALFIVFMVLNNSLNKLIEKEEERQRVEE